MFAVHHTGNIIKVERWKICPNQHTFHNSKSPQCMRALATYRIAGRSSHTTVAYLAVLGENGTCRLHLSRSRNAACHNRDVTPRESCARAKMDCSA